MTSFRRFILVTSRPGLLPSRRHISVGDSRGCHASTLNGRGGRPPAWAREEAVEVKGGRQAVAVGSSDGPAEEELVSLLRKVASGDIDAWGELWVHLFADVIRFVAGRLRLDREHPRVNEVATDTFERVRLKAGNFRGSSQVRTWILGIANNVLRESVRQWDRQLRHDLIGMGGDASEAGSAAGSDSEEVERLREELIQGLPSAQRDALERDLSHSDVKQARAGLEGAALVNHRKNASRAREALLTRIRTDERYERLRRPWMTS